MVSPGPHERLHIGTAGWSYPDWRGIFYPEPRPPRFSELRFAAERFDCLEINSTFYRLPEPRLAASWARQVEDLEGFVFTAKLYRELTHGRPSVREIPRLCRAFREGVEPLAEAGRLGCILLQFPWSFDDRPESRALLEALAENLQPLTLAVEVRHRSFLEKREDPALDFLTSLGLHFVNIDLPRGRTSPPPTTVNTGPVGYFRLHGRNARSWFRRDATRDEKYNYLYTLEEIVGLLPAMEQVAARTEVTYVVTNNHYRGQAPANAFQILSLLGRPRPVPEPLVREFPFLAGSPGAAPAPAPGASPGLPGGRECKDAGGTSRSPGRS